MIPPRAAVFVPALSFMLSLSLSLNSIPYFRSIVILTQLTNKREMHGTKVFRGRRKSYVDQRQTEHRSVKYRIIGCPDTDIRWQMATPMERVVALPVLYPCLLIYQPCIHGTQPAIFAPVQSISTGFNTREIVILKVLYFCFRTSFIADWPRKECDSILKSYAATL